MASFFAGTLYTLHIGINNCSFGQQDTLNLQIEELAQKRLRELQSNLPKCEPQPVQQQPPVQRIAQQQQQDHPLQFPTQSMGKYLVGAARTLKQDFFDHLDLGVPMDLPGNGDSEVLLLYQRENALPTRYMDYSESLPHLEATEALEHCEFLNVVLVDHSKARNQCLAIIPQYESYILQRYMRLPEERPPGTHPRDNLVSEALPLRLVGRGVQKNGNNEFSPPLDKHIQTNWNILQTYFAVFDDVLKELKPILEKVATPNKTVTVMVSNFGQSELLVNFVCAAKARNMDTSNIVVFATDQDTKDLAEHLGLAAFYDERNFGSMPQEAAGSYGDRKFTAMMMAKVFCVHMVNALKYNVLFQDVDIVYYKNPIPFFEQEHTNFDLLFQDDGGHTVRYAPYSANSGFYYVRYNPRTRYFFNALLLSGDLIQSTDSHQQALIALLSDHSSLFGLKTKVFSRDSWEFPGGYQYHQKSGKYMRDFFNGRMVRSRTMRPSSRFGNSGVW
eukprot:CAMPEP_0176021354 /NCGR_PEP_ID=MMETSP0120_2-20121206/10367_1 /TAXON_ID=160619 /ORGANISM="Kryptoperidinium foliaceum, Strain CCMP 1326" /LENGTH=501 /DNA_ID=CAMNT_0017354467 /DNA_START=53 /DNA_END=1555 /DNA_ORIENTATION=+